MENQDYLNVHPTSSVLSICRLSIISLFRFDLSTFEIWTKWSKSLDYHYCFIKSPFLTRFYFFTIFVVSLFHIFCFRFDQEHDGLIDRWKRKDMENLLELHNKTPVWNDGTSSHTNHFPLSQIPSYCQIGNPIV